MLVIKNTLYSKIGEFIAKQITSDNFVEFPKAFFPIVVTLLPIVTLIKDVQEDNFNNTFTLICPFSP